MRCTPFIRAQLSIGGIRFNPPHLGGLTSSIKSYIEELLHEQPVEHPVPTPIPTTFPPSSAATRVFISHASADTPFVEELIEILEMIGLTHDQIFCTSFTGYGIDHPDRILQRGPHMKNEPERIRRRPPAVLYAVGGHETGSP